MSEDVHDRRVVLLSLETRWTTTLLANEMRSEIRHGVIKPASWQEVLFSVWKCLKSIAHFSFYVKLLVQKTKLVFIYGVI